jgi:hypothetical protein
MSSLMRLEVNMAYVSPNAKSLKELREWLKAGKVVTVYQPGLGTVPRDGEIDVEGPHYPAAHIWYGQATLKGGRVVKVR